MFHKYYSLVHSSDDDDYNVNIRAQRQADDDYDDDCDDDCDDDYKVNIRAQKQAAPPNAGFRL